MWNFCLPPFFVITCLCSADAFGVEKGFEFSCCHLRLRFYFCSSLLVSLPSRVRDDFCWCKGSWNTYIPTVLCCLVLWISCSLVHFLDLIYTLWVFFSWASQFPFSWRVDGFSILCTLSSKTLKFTVAGRAHSDSGILFWWNLFDHLKLAVCVLNTWNETKDALSFRVKDRNTVG